MTDTAIPKKRGRGRREVLDKSLVNGETLAVCGHYLGAPTRSSGARASWHCPACGKDKFEASRSGVGGCWNADCPVPTSTDAVGLIAFFEELDPARDFLDVLKKGYDLLGLLDPPSAGAAKRTRRAGTRIKAGRLPAGPMEAHDADPELTDAVYRRFLALCPLHERDRRYLTARGLAPETIRRGRFGSTTAKRTRAVLERLVRVFREEDLTKVPGFFKNGGGRLAFTLTGDYLLIPYHDRNERVTTIEGRYAGEGKPPIKAKYLSLRGSGTHLYVFPGSTADELEAFTEGPMGAILAAQEGIRVGSIKGIRSHKGQGGGPLPELAGADFGGRTVPYIPDADDPPKSDVLQEAPKAARNLTVPHNGRPALAALPRGQDLDEWLISLPKRKRCPAFQHLLARASPLGEERDEEHHEKEEKS